MNAAVPCYYHLDVELSQEKVGQVRRILAAHLRYWNLENLVESVGHCAEALLRTIEQHAADKNTTIEMWWNGRRLFAAVSDSSQDIGPHRAPQGCLAQIAALSDGWGCCATGTGGKIIWSSWRARAADRAPLDPPVPAPCLRVARPTPLYAVLPEPALAAGREEAGPVVSRV
ncbi:pep a2 [Streptomyces sp. NPDC059618]|uniref:pep a2 n=1 Tax=Streptomyces sp. NPDC059618 TaxID=3346887 RepID=UPI0036CF0ABE